MEDFEEKNVAFQTPTLPMLLKRLSMVPEIDVLFVQFFTAKMLDHAEKTVTENTLLAAIGSFVWNFESSCGTAQEEILAKIRTRGAALISVFVIDEKIAERMCAKLNEHYKD